MIEINIENEKFQLIINIYNLYDKNLIDKFHKFLQNNINIYNYNIIIMKNDFNIYYLI